MTSIPTPMVDPNYYGESDAAPFPGAFAHYSRNAVPATDIWPVTNWNYNVEALSSFGCPHCASEDLSFWGETGNRTDADLTDHVECNSCGASWEAPAIRFLLAAMASTAKTLDGSKYAEALSRADAVSLNNMSDEDAAIVARGIVLAVAAGEAWRTTFADEFIGAGDEVAIIPEGTTATIATGIVVDIQEDGRAIINAETESNPGHGWTESYTLADLAHIDSPAARVAR